MKNLLIVGAGQYGMVAKEIAASMKRFDRIRFVDDNSSLAVGKIADLEKLFQDYDSAAVAISNSVIRLNLIVKLTAIVIMYHVSCTRAPMYLRLQWSQLFVESRITCIEVNPERAVHKCFLMLRLLSIQKGVQSGSRWRLVLIVGVLFSIVIEITQYITCRGLCELDDVVCNDSGTLIGYWLYIAFRHV